jgi:hypothetical protein
MEKGMGRELCPILMAASLRAYGIMTRMLRVLINKYFAIKEL